MNFSLKFSEYIIFADESGDHGLATINPENPIFVLVFCIFKKIDYFSVVKQAITKFKIDFWGHDLAILHSHDIRKSKGDFAFLFNEEIRRVFLHTLNETVKQIPFSIIAVGIDKRDLKISESNYHNPYLLALGLCLERTLQFLDERKQIEHLTHIIVESRGKVEDQDLTEAFKEISKEANLYGDQYPLDIRLASKKTNSCGLQIADLVAYPIARHLIKKDQPNKAFETIREKLWGYPEYADNGLNFFALKNEMPR